MKRVLFITDGEAPYRTVFFNQLAKKVELTVVCESQTSSARDKSWNSQNQIEHNVVYLGKERYEKRGKTSFAMVYYVLKNFNSYDEVIFGCVNTKPQIFTYTILRLLGKSYSFNFDGETIFDDKGIKLFIKKNLLNGANKYYIAGEKSTESLKKTLNNKNAKFIPYFFSSLTEKEITENKEKYYLTKRNDFILVVGRYFAYKGMDIAVEVAKLMPNIKFKFVGMGNKSEEFIELCNINQLNNIEIIPFLSKDKLEIEYLTCRALLLPSRRECWGLVVNEAASYGTPIVSTYGSGAAVEFIAKNYSQLLAKPNDIESLIGCIDNFLMMTSIENQEYSKFLIEKNEKYTIEENVDEFVKGINGN